MKNAMNIKKGRKNYTRNKVLENKKQENNDKNLKVLEFKDKKVKVFVPSSPQSSTQRLTSDIAHRCLVMEGDHVWWAPNAPTRRLVSLSTSNLASRGRDLECHVRWALELC